MHAIIIIQVERNESRAKIEEILILFFNAFCNYYTRKVTHIAGKRSYKQLVVIYGSEVPLYWPWTLEYVLYAGVRTIFSNNHRDIK